ncbi:S46 family peptidase [Chondromyces apiculatus]|uniref:Dipeptidyl-peptidase n=1 Tax=Chondromyces apiculatus DSM 436 TaxID=1192034 RepID=A0A017TBN8_9BACT|nr:S46 family peptidase [Chondromyces apiculatus]EYF06337.1 Hypothetical protein CAP_2215 [Chondromyces apiculatus DSM 436]
MTNARRRQCLRLRSTTGLPSVLALAALAAFVPACGAQPPSEPAAPGAGEPAPPPAPPAAAPRFENPGGMWMPEQLASQEAWLKQAGFQMDPRALLDPTAFPLGAVVSLGGCSASFVSADGLVATNHHCSGGALQHNSTPEEDMQQNGFLAKNRADERWAGPLARVFVTRSLRDVSAEVNAGLDAVKDGIERYKKIEERQKQLVSACEKGRPELRCSVASYFGGAEYRLIEQLEIKDVRMVYIPPEGVGNFGGDVDNWRWPRHGGDFAFFRAYVGKDGKPANHAADNVPYKPPHHLKVATTPLKEGDFVMVAGYPGRTNRLRTAAEVETAVAWEYPARVALFKELIGLLKDLSRDDKALQIKALPRIEGLSNYLLKTEGLLDGLVQDGLAKKKEKVEADLKAWIAADPKRKEAYGGAIEQMAKVHAGIQATREQDALVDGAMWLARLVSTADSLVRMAEERAKPDAERDPVYQERNWQRLEQGMVALQKGYDRRLDTALFKVFLRRMAALPEKDRPVLFTTLFGKATPTEADLDKKVADLYGKTKLEDEATRVKLLKTATTAQLKASQDPLIKLAVAIRPSLKAMEDQDKAYEGAMSAERPRFVAALRTFQGGALAPDANGTLRITYGTVRGYKPRPDAEAYVPFTGVSGILKKDTGKEPFASPPALLAAVKDKKFGPYVNEAIGEVPVDFLSDLDITGGNSGSATMNARGELVGLAFDGNYEAMASDWLFMPSITRTIHVDLRYMLWVMDAVGNADDVLRELGVKPAIP